MAGKEVLGLMDMLTNYVCIIPKARAAPARATLSHRSLLPAWTAALEGPVAAAGVREAYGGMHTVCRPAAVRQQLYFPDKRLLQYDCGKLQVLDEMLRKLKSGGHRVLMFTQMSKVLDVVETFLSFHGHTYIRLDGSTKIETRQMLVERFNQDPKIFMFISSTRAGGVGINLTGADTVIFYDSDWNPAMDKQAQDRCHRIGQTREVNIYRLVSEHTVEENILKKANQKLHLESLALKDGASSLFNPEMFKKMDVRELFDKPDEAPPPEASNPLAHLRQAPAQPGKDKAKVVVEQKLLTDKEWEMAIASAEDERDVEAMKMAKQEEKEELADFNEDEANANGGGEEGRQAGAGNDSDEVGPSKAEAVALAIESELTEVQRYALHFLEKEYREAGIALVEGVSFDKDKWEQDQLRRIRDQDADRLYDEDEILYYEVSGCSQQVYRELVTRLSLGSERSYLDFGCFYEPPNADDDKHTYVNEPMYQDAGMRSPHKKNQRPGPPNAKQIKIKFIVPGQGQPGQPGQPGRPGQPGQKPGVPGRPGAPGQPPRQDRKKPISAGEVPWTKEEEQVLREAVERFHGVSTLPIRTWHLHASILNSAIAARGRFRMGKHCMEYWNARLAAPPAGQGGEGQQQGGQPGQPGQPKPGQYQPRQQTVPPSREDNIAAIIRSFKATAPKPGAPTSGQSTKQQREAMQQVQAHESHRSALTAAAQQMQVNASLLLSPSELIKRIANKPPSQQSQQQHHHGHGSQMARPGQAGQVPGHAGQMGGRPGQMQQGQPRPGMMPGQRPGVPGGGAGGQTAASKIAGAAGHPSHAAAMQAGRPVGQKPPGPGQSSSTVVLGSAGASAQMAHANTVVGMQPGRPTPGGAGSAAARVAQGGMGGASAAQAVHQQQLQAQQQQQRMQAQAVQHQAARQAAIAQQQMRAQNVQQGAPQPHGTPVPSVPSRPGAYSQPMPPPAGGGLISPQHPQSTMAQAMQQQQRQQAQAMAQASTRQRKPKGGGR